MLSKEAWKTGNFQKMKTCSYSYSFKKKIALKIKRYLQVTAETSNCTYWKIFPQLSTDIRISLLIKVWFLVLKNLN